MQMRIFKPISSRARGLTLVEVLIAFFILAVLTGLGAVSFRNLTADRALTLETEKVLSLLSRARSYSLSARDGAVWGVHVESTRVTLFRGSSYTEGGTGNIPVPLHRDVYVSEVTLSGGGNSIVFSKLTGATTNTGTVTLAEVRDATATSSITIDATGSAYAN